MAVNEVPEGPAVSFLSPKLTELFAAIELVFLAVVEGDLVVVSLKLCSI